MDSVEYSGLRQYLLSQAKRECRIRRELWNCNGIAYATFRKYLNHVREFGFPEDQKLSSPPIAVSLRRSSIEQLSFGRMEGWRRRSSGLSSMFCFSGVRHILDACSVPITAICYGHLSSNLIAYGSADGNVWIATLMDYDSEVKKLGGGHTKEIMDLAWSLDNSLLMTCGLEGNVCLWNTEEGVCSRLLRMKQATYSCRFHPLNQNLFIIAVGGDVVAINGSTGSRILKHTVMPANLGDYITAMVCSNTFTVVGGKSGTLYMLKCEHKLGGQMAFAQCYRAPCQKGKESSVSGIQHQGYSALTKGPALLVTYADSTVRIYKVHDVGSCWLEPIIKSITPPAARRINAVWCPPSAGNGVENIAIGGEDKNVHIYDVTRQKGGPLLVNELQAHSSPVVGVCWSFDGTGLASGDCDGTVIVWKKDDLKQQPMSP